MRKIATDRDNVVIEARREEAEAAAALAAPTADDMVGADVFGATSDTSEGDTV
jgi:DNA-directed RNA polymerase subunit beta'